MLDQPKGLVVYYLIIQRKEVSCTIDWNNNNQIHNGQYNRNYNLSVMCNTGMKYMYMYAEIH